MTASQFEEMNHLQANIGRALADPKRILILNTLYERPIHVSALAEYLDIPQPTISRHLRILRHQSLVVAKREGSSVVYHIADLRIIEVLEIMRQIQCDSLIRRSDLLQTSLTA